MCRGSPLVLRGSFDLINGTDRTVMYEPPETADILVDGDLAVLQLTWIDTITAADGTMRARPAIPGRSRSWRGVLISVSVAPQDAPPAMGGLP